ncbi:hypothetical protein BG011_006920 [Mortierella polycephala]|uniref:F-box domain-containing protein n=1 Tax=Mortierella polycephala TaxID=41804 RepID=A0A9P6TYD5_9FUNG|nr:hypothetical protein BG011_006920 [Mortierella polycephala]
MVTRDDNISNVGNNGNVPDDADQTDIAMRDTRPASLRVLDTPELVGNILKFVPLSKFRVCSQINHFWRHFVLDNPLTFGVASRALQEQFESGPRWIYLLSTYVLQYCPNVLATHARTGTYQFIFSCQARSGSGSADSYGSANSDSRSSSSRSGTESSGSQSHLQRHHTHQPGHDLEPFRSFHTYQSSAIVPNVYFRTEIHRTRHLSSSTSRPSSQSQPRSTRYSPHQQSQPITFQSPSSQSALWPSIDQMSGFSGSSNANLSDNHPYEADISTDSHTSSILLDVSDMSLSPTPLQQDFLTFPQDASIVPSSAPRSAVLKVVPCPYEHPSDEPMSYEGSTTSVKKGSRTSSGSDHSQGEDGGTAEQSSTHQYLQDSQMPYSTVADDDSTTDAVIFSTSLSSTASPLLSSSGEADTSSIYAPYGAGSRGGSSATIQPHAVTARSRHGKERATPPNYQRHPHRQRAHHSTSEYAHHQHPNYPADSSELSDLVLDTTSGGDSGDPLQHYGSGTATDTGSSSSYSRHHQVYHHQHGAPSTRRTGSTTIASTSASATTVRQQLQQQQQQQQHSRPSRNWCMAIQTFYYQRAALNAMIVACREHMESSEGQGGHIVERTETSRIVWNETTRQEHIWTITPTLMDRTNPGDFIERDFDAHSEPRQEPGGNR